MRPRAWLAWPPLAFAIGTSFEAQGSKGSVDAVASTPDTAGVGEWFRELVFPHIRPCCSSLPSRHLPDEVQAIATLIEKQAQIVVKPRLVSEEEKQRKAALLAQYADVTDEEEYPFQGLRSVSGAQAGSICWFPVSLGKLPLPAIA